MKTYLVWLPVSLLIITTGIYTGVKKYDASKKTIDKCISFSVYKGNDYTSKVYNSSYASVQIIIEKVSNKNRIPVWVKNYDTIQLKKYPSLENAISKKVIVTGVHEKEHLEIIYTIIYNSKGSELQMQNRSVVINCCNNSKIEIGI